MKRGLTLVTDPARVEASLWRRLRFEGEQRCRELLFDRYVVLARQLAHRQARSRRRPGADNGDLEQFAFEGLLQALDRFDPLRGVPFGAYARRRIAGIMADGMTRMSDLDAQFGERRRRQQERVRSLMEDADTLTSLDRLADLALDLAIGLMLEGTGLIEPADGADQRGGAYEGLVWHQQQTALAREIERLPASEMSVVRHHYATGLSFAAIADLLRLSRGRVSQLHRAAIERLRRRLRCY